MTIDLDAIREHTPTTRDGFYHVVGPHRVMRAADFDALFAEVERLRVNADARERFLKREGDLLRYVQRERDDLRTMVDGLETAAHEERAAVVAYLLAPGTSCDNVVLAEAIENGEHRVNHGR